MVARLKLDRHTCDESHFHLQCRQTLGNKFSAEIGHFVPAHFVAEFGYYICLLDWHLQLGRHVTTKFAPAVKYRCKKSGCGVFGGNKLCCEKGGGAIKICPLVSAMHLPTSQNNHIF